MCAKVAAAQLATAEQSTAQRSAPRWCSGPSRSLSRWPRSRQRTVAAPRRLDLPCTSSTTTNPLRACSKERRGLPTATSLDTVAQDARSLPRSPQERRIALEAVVGTHEGQSGGQPDPNRADGGEALHRMCWIAWLVPVLCQASMHACSSLARARAHSLSLSRARARALSALQATLATRARSVVASTSTRTTRAPSSGA